MHTISRRTTTETYKAINRTIADIRNLFRSSKIVSSQTLVPVLKGHRISKCYQQGIRKLYLVKLSPKKAAQLGHPVENKSRGVYYQLSPKRPAPGLKTAVQIHTEYYSLNVRRPQPSQQKHTVLTLLNKKEVESFSRKGKTLTIQLT